MLTWTAVSFARVIFWPDGWSHEWADIQMRIDQKVLVKDLVRDDHQSASKVVRESFVNRVRESNLVFFAKDFDMAWMQGNIMNIYELTKIDHEANGYVLVLYTVQRCWCCFAM